MEYRILLPMFDTPLMRVADTYVIELYDFPLSLKPP